MWAADHGADVISCSWGPEDGDWFDPSDPLHRRRVPLPASTRLAIDYAVTQGRGGKGCVVLFAAGNGNESVDNDGYASYAKVIAVAACNDRGKRSVYSDFGDAVWCAFPSNDFGSSGVRASRAAHAGHLDHRRVGRPAATTDGNRSRGGDRPGNYTNLRRHLERLPGRGRRGGAGPLATRRCAGTRSRTCCAGPATGSTRRAGSGAPTGHSPWYGFGRLNAENAVRLALPQPADRLVISRSFSEAVHDLDTAKVTLDVNEDRALADLKVVIDIRHSYIGDLAVALVAPNFADERVLLHHRSGGNGRDLHRTYDAVDVPELSRFVGHSAKGSWTLEVLDEAAGDSGRIAGFGLELAFE